MYYKIIIKYQNNLNIKKYINIILIKMKWLLNFYNVRYSPEYQKKRAQKSIKAKIFSKFLEYYLLLLLTFIPIVANAPIRQKECLSNYIQS